MGAARYLISWTTLLFFEIVVPFLLASSLSFGYLTLVLVALAHTIALGSVARMHQRIVMTVALLICLCNLAALMLYHDVSALHALLG